MVAIQQSRYYHLVDQLVVDLCAQLGVLSLESALYHGLQVLKPCLLHPLELNAIVDGIVLLLIFVEPGGVIVVIVVFPLLQPLFHLVVAFVLQLHLV